MTTDETPLEAPAPVPAPAAPPPEPPAPVFTFAPANLVPFVESAAAQRRIRERADREQTAMKRIASICEEMHVHLEAQLVIRSGQVARHDVACVANG